MKSWFAKVKIFNNPNNIVTVLVHADTEHKAREQAIGLVCKEHNGWCNPEVVYINEMT